MKPAAPRAQAAAPDDAAPAGGTPADCDDGRCNILIVDDLPEKLLVFRTVLEDLGQNLVFVRSGSEALREVLHREFAVILLDVNMPDIDGFETAALIRKYKKSAHTPIIFITSYADDAQTQRGYALGAVDFILSPLVPEVLRTKVKVFVDLHVMQERVRRQGDERGKRMAAEAAKRAAEENDRRSAFLAEASQVLSASLELPVAERALLDLAVPRLAALGLLLRTEDGALSRGTVALGMPDTPPERISYAPVRHDQLPAALRRALERALAGGRRVVLADAELQGLAPPLFGLRCEPETLRSAVAVPLLTGERRSGVLLLACGTPDAGNGTRDWSFTLEQLASRAAISFENAELYHSLQAEIVERRAAEAELQQVNQRKDEFLAMLSHELRNPLAPIRNALELIRRIAPPDPKFVWAGEVMDRQVHHLTRLVEELLDVARISEGKIALAREPVDLKAVIAQSVETAQPYIEQRQHALSVSLPDTPVWLQGDFARLSQVVANLLNNAAKYSGERGSIHVELRVEDGEALITVRDKGVGIDAHLLPRVFDLFSQGTRSLDRAQGGLGVGLTLVRRLVELHGGRVEAHSAGPDQGSEFRVHIPCISVVRGDDEPASAPRQALQPARGRRVLIVDDNRDAAESTAQFLQLEGHVVKAVGDGPAALACVAVFAPQVVVLDIGLPGLSGYEVAERLRQLPETKGALLLALTGYGQKEDRQRAEAAGFDHHLVKPADPQRLVELIGCWEPGGALSPAAPARPGRGPRSGRSTRG